MGLTTVLTEFPQVPPLFSLILLAHQHLSARAAAVFISSPDKLGSAVEYSVLWGRCGYGTAPLHAFTLGVPCEKSGKSATPTTSAYGSLERRAEAVFDVPIVRSLQRARSSFPSMLLLLFRLVVIVPYCKSISRRRMDFFFILGTSIFRCAHARVGRATLFPGIEQKLILPPRASVI